jgi:glycosyltransferase involved in cell wall biosynthesis
VSARAGTRGQAGAEAAREAWSVGQLALQVATVPGFVAAISQELPVQVPKCIQPRKVLFLSRILPTKGIEILLRAWVRVRPVGWKLDIVGPWRPAYVSSLESLAVRLEIRDSVRFHPPQFGKREKNDLRG